jgi:hypothetical protein
MNRTSAYTKLCKAITSLVNLQSGEILGSHGGEYEDEIGLMMEAVSTSETSVNFEESTRHNVTEDNHIQSG